MSTKAHIVTADVMRAQCEGDEYAYIGRGNRGQPQVKIEVFSGDSAFHVSNSRVARQLAWQLLEAADELETA
jgi:hypothetical protein